MNRVSIGIQARSTSKRFPNKVNALIGKKTMLQHVMEASFKAAQYINNWNSEKSLVDVALLIPHGDPLKNKVATEINVIEGPEDDVLSRYVMLQSQLQSDFICRVTADCPMIPPFIISKLITLAVMNKYDYVSNVDERCRTAPDGWDCEVISKKALAHLNETTTDKNDREHVTIALRESPPEWLFSGAVVGFIDISDKKLSVDTMQDLDFVIDEMKCVSSKVDVAGRVFGRGHVHRL